MSSNLTFDTDDDDITFEAPKSRYPTVKDLLDENKQLRQENFQLRVRIYTDEQQRCGKATTNKFDPSSRNELAIEYFGVKKERDDLKKEADDRKKDADDLRRKLDELLLTSKVGSEERDLTNKVQDLQISKDSDNRDGLISNLNQQIANMTKALVEMGSKLANLEEDCKNLEKENHKMKEDFVEKQEECKSLMKECDSLRMGLKSEKQKTEELAFKLKECESYVQQLLKEQEINNAQRTGEIQLKERQLQVQNQQMGNLLADNQVLMERLRVSEDALKLLHQEHSKLVLEIQTLRSGYISLSGGNELLGAHGDNKSDIRQDTSPDLGVESGQDVASTDGNLYAENEMLRERNEKLLQKLHQMRQQLNTTVSRLSNSTKHNQQVEQTLCRRLHKTHNILKEAKFSLEQKQSQQVLTNLLPPSV